MTKEREKQLIAQGWKQEIIDPFRKKEEWVKEFLCLPVMFTRMNSFTQLCVGIFYYDKHLNELHLFHLTDEKFFMLFDVVESSPTKYDIFIEMAFECCDKKIKKETFKIKDLYQDECFFGCKIDSKFYVAYGERSMLLYPDIYNCAYFFYPKYLMYDMHRKFQSVAMNDFSEDEVVYKKYKLNDNANT